MDTKSARFAFMSKFMTSEPEMKDTPVEICEPPATSSAEARKRAEKLISAAWPQIIAKCVDEADTKRSVPHAKFLFEYWQSVLPKESKEKTKAETEEKKEDVPEQDPVCLMIDRLIEAVALLHVEKDKDQLN